MKGITSKVLLGVLTLSQLQSALAMGPAAKTITLAKYAAANTVEAAKRHPYCVRALAAGLGFAYFVSKLFPAHIVTQPKVVQPVCAATTAFKATETPAMVKFGQDLSQFEVDGAAYYQALVRHNRFLVETYGADWAYVFFRQADVPENLNAAYRASVETWHHDWEVVMQDIAELEAVYNASHAEQDRVNWETAKARLDECIHKLKADSLKL
jgi:hypothetical protein